MKSGRYRCFNKPVVSFIRVESKDRGSRLFQNVVPTTERVFPNNDCYRFIVIVFPMKSRSVCTISNCRRAIVLVWLVSVILTSPVIFTKVSAAQFLCSDTNSRRISQPADGRNKLGPSAEFWMQVPVSLLQVQDSLQKVRTPAPVYIRSPTANLRTCQHSKTKVCNQSNDARRLLTVSGSSLSFDSCVDTFLALETRGLPWLKTFCIWNAIRVFSMPRPSGMI